MTWTRPDQLTHGQSHGGAKGHGTPEYTAWLTMRARCHNPNHAWYHRYGGRGIKVCDHWNYANGGFENFYADMGPRPPKHTLERLNNNGNYAVQLRVANATAATAQHKRQRIYIFPREDHGSVGSCRSVWDEIRYRLETNKQTWLASPKSPNGADPWLN